MSETRSLYLSFDPQSVGYPQERIDGERPLDEYDIIFFDPNGCYKELGFYAGPIKIQNHGEGVQLLHIYQILKNREKQLERFFERGGQLCTRLRFERFYWEVPTSISSAEEIAGRRTDPLFWIKRFFGRTEFLYGVHDSGLAIPDIDDPTVRLFVNQAYSYSNPILSCEHPGFHSILRNRNNQTTLGIIEVNSNNGRVFFYPEFEDTGVQYANLELLMRAFHAEPQSLDEPTPSWIGSYQSQLDEFRLCTAKVKEIEEQLLKLEDQRTTYLQSQRKLASWSKLLYGTGRLALEPTVRDALRLMGFTVPSPDDGKHLNDYDFHLELNGAIVAIGEVEGTENRQIKIGKFRQLLDHIHTDELEPGQVKGILVGNADRGNDPQARTTPFSDKVLSHNQKQKFCLLPSTELYAICCFILNSDPDADQLDQIRRSILDCDGVYKFDTTRSK